MSPSFTRRQAAAAILLRQVVPFQPAKIKLVQYLYVQLRNPSKQPIQRYLLVRDIVFFIIDFFTGDRASDLGRLQSHSVFRLPNASGFLLNVSFGKTLRAPLRDYLCCCRHPLVTFVRFFGSSTTWIIAVTPPSPSIPGTFSVQLPVNSLCSVVRLLVQL